jgi:enoyl-[acyl-carrier protein] reductase I
MSGDGEKLTPEDFLLTLDAMAVSWYAWTKDLLDLDLFAPDAMVLAFTSEGNTRPIQNYGAVSAAKAALEAIGRNMALEFAPRGIRVNCIQAGVTETRSFSMIPGSGEIKKFAMKRNPSGRLTLPEDVANVVYLLSREEARWITGTVIKADGGESLR